LNPVVGRRIKSEIERAVPEDSRDKGTIDTGVLNEATAENDLANMLQFQGEYISTSDDTRVECRSKHAIPQHPRHAAAGKTILADKRAANHNATIRLDK